MPPEPIARFARWFRDAARAGVPQPDAVALATAAPSGAPSVRFVLLKEATARGFVIYTDSRSRKGRELQANTRAALAFHWQPLGRQVRVEGRVRPVTSAEADAYWRTRPRGSQLSAATSQQSARLESRASLVARRRALERSLRGRDVPRPATWTGFRIEPRAIEFWTHRDDRLHHRERFERTRRGWRRLLLEP
jgi:pyridoxamine 5'-phosphate oxidase